MSNWWFGKNSWFYKFCRWADIVHWFYKSVKQPLPEMEVVVEEIITVVPPEIVKLPKDLQYDTTKMVVAPYFLKGLPINTGEVTDGEVEEFAKIITGEAHGNYLRFLCDFGFYGRPTIAVLEPFFNKVDGKFDLNSVSEKWVEKFRRRVSYFVDRGWKIEFNFLNNSTLHTIPGGYWNANPVNEINNHGFPVPELGGALHCTHWEPDAWVGHWSQWDTVDANSLWHIKHGYNTEADLNEEETKDMNACRATREVFYKYMKFMLDLCNKEWGTNYRIGQNEWASRIGFHNSILAPLYENFGITRDRRVTSLLYQDWYVSGDSIFNQFDGSWHSVGSSTNCKLGKDTVGLSQILEYLPSRDFIFSGDGKPKCPTDQLDDIVTKSLTHGLGYERNCDFNIKLSDIDIVGGNIMGSAYKRFLG